MAQKGRDLSYFSPPGMANAIPWEAPKARRREIPTPMHLRTRNARSPPPPHISSPASLRSQCHKAWDFRNLSPDLSRFGKLNPAIKDLSLGKPYLGPHRGKRVSERVSEREVFRGFLEVFRDFCRGFQSF